MSKIKVFLNGIYFSFDTREDFLDWRDKLDDDAIFLEIDPEHVLNEEDLELDTDVTLSYSEKPMCDVCETGPKLDDDFCPVCGSNYEKSK